MIYYFSGTHNSRYAALRLGSQTGQRVLFIPEEDPYRQDFNPATDDSLGIVFPVYAWGVPPIVIDFIERLPEGFVQRVRDNNVAVWSVATCGDETGMAMEMLRKELSKRGLQLSGAWSLLMPNVYVLLPGFGVDTKEVEEHKLTEAIGRIKHIASRIDAGNWENDVYRGPWPRLKTTMIYPLFKRWGVDSRKWHYTDACIGCGKCARACPVGNIAMREGHPQWGNDCTSCCACYHVCPTRGAQYGSITRNAGQFYNHDC